MLAISFLFTLLIASALALKICETSDFAEGDIFDTKRVFNRKGNAFISSEAVHYAAGSSEPSIVGQFDNLGGLKVTTAIGVKEPSRIAIEYKKKNGKDMGTAYITSPQDDVSCHVKDSQGWAQITYMKHITSEEPSL
jgi:hypothetical protein